MRTRKLGRSEIEVGEIALGTWGLSGEAYGPVEPGVARATIEAALDAGGNCIETAACYGPDGAVEKALGEVIRDRGRDAVVIIDRIGIDRWPDGSAHKKFEPPDLMRLANASLARLGTDYVDAFVMHNPLPATLTRRHVLDGLRQLRHVGKARLVGVSAGSIQAARLALDAEVDLIELPYNLLYPQMLHAVVGDIVRAGAGVVVRSPLAYGVLASTWAADRKFGDDDHRAQRWALKDIARRVRQREAARFLVHGDVTSLREAAIRFVLANHVVSVVAVGARTPEMARENAHAADALPYLPDGDLTAIPARMREAGVVY